MKKLVLILAATNVALGAVVLHLVAELRRERAAALQLEARVADVERAPARTPQPSPFTALERSEPATPAAAQAPAAPPPPLKISQSPPTLAHAAPINVSKEERVAMMRESMERQRALLRDPQYRDAMRLQQKAMLPSMYPDLTTELDLSADAMDQLMSLLADQQIREMERDRPFFEGAPDPTMVQELVREQQEHQTAMDNEIRDLLGEDKWRAWNEYKSTMSVRHELSQMRNTLALQGAPLEEHQVKPLQRALVEAQQRQMQDWNRAAVQAAAKPMAGGESSQKQQLALQAEALRRQRQHHERLLESLEPVLTEAQLRRVREQQDAQLKLQEAHLRMMQAQAEAEASGRIMPQAEPAVGEAMMVTNGALFVEPSR